MDISKLKIAYKWMASDFRDFFTGECQFHYGWNITKNPVGFWVTEASDATHFMTVHEKIIPNASSICMEIKYAKTSKIRAVNDSWGVHLFTVDKFFMPKKLPVKVGLIPVFWTGESWSLNKKDFWKNTKENFFVEEE